MSLVTSTKVESVDDEQLDVSLRPKKMSEYIGQDKMKQNLLISLQAAQKRGDALDHLLFYGPPGLGKTTISHVIANEMGVNIKVTSGPAIERAGDLASILTNLQERDILFIDEIHRLSRVVEEVMYPAMEDFALDIVIGKGPSARNVRLDLPKFTIIGATTRMGMLSSPLRDRFGIIHRLEFYDDDALYKIVQRAAQVLGVGIEDEAAGELAKRSRGTPRIANRLLKRVRDFAQVKHDSGIISKKVVRDALSMLDVDEEGMDASDRRVLEVIMKKFGGGPVGIETLATSLSEDVGTVEEVLEPYLLMKGFIRPLYKEILWL